MATKDKVEAQLRKTMLKFKVDINPEAMIVIVRGQALKDDPHSTPVICMIEGNRVKLIDTLTDLMAEDEDMAELIVIASMLHMSKTAVNASNSMKDLFRGKKVHKS